MAQIKIYGLREHLAAVRERLSDAVHSCVVDALAYPGLYLVDKFQVGGPGEYPGADRVTGWFNRNLRIFANVQRITEPPDERILLVIGGGQLAILRHCVQASPEYELVEAAEYLARQQGT